MKKQVYLVAIGSFALMFVVSCTSMRSAHYVGKKNPVFEGHYGVSIWKKDSTVFHVKPIDDYTAVVSTLEWDKTLGKFKQIDSVIIVSELNEQLFLNVKTEGEFTIVRMTPSLSGSLVLFEANSSKLKDDVKSGLIKVKENVDEAKIDPVFTLEMSKRELDKYVSENMNELFEMSSVAVISPIVVPTTEEEEDNGKQVVSKGSIQLLPKTEETTDNH